MGTFSGVIYKWVSPSGKVYIGQTCRPRERKRLFLKASKRYGGVKLEAARKKYPPELWTYSIVEVVHCSTRELLHRAMDALEIYYISAYDSFNIGYNSTLGGDGWDGYIRSKSIGKKIALKLKKPVRCYKDGILVASYASITEAVAASGVHSYSIISSCNGKYNNCISGFDWCYESDLDRISFLEVSGCRRHHLLQFTPEGKLLRSWNSIKDAASGDKSMSSCIQLSCCGRRDVTYGYCWSWDDNLDRIKMLSDRYAQYIGDGFPTEVILQYHLSGDLLSWYSDSASASRCLFGDSKNRGRINLCCKGELPNVYGFRWERRLVLLKLSSSDQLYIHKIL